MKIEQKFNTLTKEEYFFFIDNYKKYSDFNTLGLYRSIIENEKLNLADKIEVRDYAHKIFQKTFYFLQLKDPATFFKISTIGQALTEGDEYKIWDDIRLNQQKILTDKKIKHRNFGTYSKHHCGYDWCPYNGLMIRQGSGLAETSIHFDSDKNKFACKIKSDKLKKERRIIKQTIKKNIENE
jgi:hypothetical protein